MLNQNHLSNYTREKPEVRYLQKLKVCWILINFNLLVMENRS